MAKVFAFPKKDELEMPAGIREALRRVAKDYVEVLYAFAVLIDFDYKSGGSFDEFMNLVATTFAEGIADAVDELDEL